MNVVLKVVEIENAGGWESGNAHPILLKVGWDEHFQIPIPRIFYGHFAIEPMVSCLTFFEFPGLL